MPKVEYIAGVTLHGIERDGEKINVAPGKPVPEVADRPDLVYMIKSGRVVEIVDGKVGAWSVQKAMLLGIRLVRKAKKKVEKPAAAGSCNLGGGDASDEVGGSRLDAAEEAKKKAAKKKAAKKKAAKKKAARKRNKK